MFALGIAAVIGITASPVKTAANIAPALSAAPALTPSPSPEATPEPAPTPEPSPSTVFGPLTGYVIGIDPGHQERPNYDKERNSPGGSKKKAKVSSGTYGRYTRVREYVINLQVALKLKENLISMGATVIMTRETHDVNISNARRAQMMNEAGADCWLRIHANGNNDRSRYGMFMLVPAKGCLDTKDDTAYKASLRLANALLDSAVESTGARSRGVFKRSDQTGFNWSKIPVCTIEMGFMTNKEEDKLLISDDYQQKIADGLAEGFVNYFLK